MKTTINKNSGLHVICVVMAAFIINFIGKYISISVNLPIWLDSIGTCVVAYLYGPVCGATVGVGANISYGFFDNVSFYYSVIGFFIGITCGVLSRKGFFDEFLKMGIMAGILSFISLIIALPINFKFYGGYTSNIWGNGVYDLILEKGIHRWIASVIAEFTIDFVDKCVVVLISALIIRMLDGNKYKSKRKNTKRRKTKKKIIATVFIITMIFAPIQEYEISVEAADVEATEIEDVYYTMTVYNDRNGLPGGEANDIAFTNDGYIWVGTYSGLYQYDGAGFEIKESDRIKSVNYIYNDEEGRMWIGTNDSGLAVMVDGKITNVINESDGLSTNSVCCIGADNSGNYYIGTKKHLNIVSMVGGIKVVDTIPQVDYARTITSGQDGYTVIVTNSGQAHVLKDGKYLYGFGNDNTEYDFTCSYYYKNELWLGTYGNTINRYNVKDDKAVFLGEIQVENLNNIRSLRPDDTGKVYVCADNGIGYINRARRFTPVYTGSFSASIDDMGVDYQGNLWFVSTRQGLLKLTESVFMNIYNNCRFESDVVNCVTKWQGKYYVGSDDGLDVFNYDFSMDSENPLISELSGQRIRNLFVDSSNHLWVSITSGKGFLEITPGYEIKVYGEEEGMLCNRFRSAIEMKDHTIAVAQDAGINFIKDGQIMSSLTKEDGLLTSMVLTMVETEDRTLYAGTDGSGVAVIKDGRIVDNIDVNDGLSSNVVLRIVEDEEGLFVVTSNGLNYIDSHGRVTYFDKFPYSNNYDLLKVDNEKLWVLSSAGIFVVDRESLVQGINVKYALLDYKYGLYGAITANSWSYFNDDGVLHIPCDNGCYIVDTKKYKLDKVPYRMSIDYVLQDNTEVDISSNREITVSGVSDITVFHVMVPNYTSNEISVGYMLEGYDVNETIVSTKDLGDIKYVNLPSGEFKFILNLYGEDKQEVLERVTYSVTKEMRIYDYTWFKTYLFIVCLLFVAWATWLLASWFSIKEREKRRQLEKDARISNETIMAIAKTVDAKDERTSKHSERVAKYAVSIASALGWSRQECEDLYKTGLLHDIGKIGIPDAVLNKPGKLTDEEYDIMKTHVDKGAEILKGFTIVKDVDLGTRFHHERYDGKGYPKGLKGTDIPIQARIIGLVDAFDAMTSNRVYRQRLDFDRVIDELKRCAGTQFDPELVEVFLKLIEDKDIDVEVLYENE